MSKYYKYLIILATTVVVVLAVWYFQNIIDYILVSAVLSLIGEPVVNLLERIKIKKFSLPKWMCAGITLLLIWVVFLTFFRIFVPMIAAEANKLSQIDSNRFLIALNEPVNRIDAFVNSLTTNRNEKFSTMALLSHNIQSVLNISMFTNVFSSLASTIGNIFIALFSITFITFFFLKDEDLFGDIILLMIPEKYEERIKEVMISSKSLLMRYFVGIGAQVSAIIVLITSGLCIVGLDFQTAIVVGLFSGIINVIPYIGPLIGTMFGLTLGLASKVQVMPTEQLAHLLIFILLVYLTVHLIDNILFQPLIFSSSVKAHPLEIFLVILVAGHLSGITGMLVAIPGYTVIRVFAKQFLNNFRVVQKLTRKI